MRLRTDRLLAGLLLLGPLVLEARQVAVARYTREGFEAAAITGLLALRSQAGTAGSDARRCVILVDSAVVEQ